jgi:hypothetical protein
MSRAATAVMLLLIGIETCNNGRPGRLRWRFWSRASAAGGGAAARGGARLGMAGMAGVGGSATLKARARLKKSGLTERWQRRQISNLEASVYS